MIQIIYRKIFKNLHCSVIYISFINAIIKD